MSRYLTRSSSMSPTIAICDRCRSKFFLTDLKRDRNSPGLLVCEDCCDEKDPYKLPQRQVENIAVVNARPDEPIVIPRPTS